MLKSSALQQKYFYLLNNITVNVLWTCKKAHDLVCVTLPKLWIVFCQGRDGGFWHGNWWESSVSVLKIMLSFLVPLWKNLQLHLDHFWCDVVGVKIGTSKLGSVLCGWVNWDLVLSFHERWVEMAHIIGLCAFQSTQSFISSVSVLCNSN